MHNHYSIRVSKVGILMKGSEALLRAIANEGGQINALQLDEWLGKLLAAGFLNKNSTEDNFYYELTDKSKEFLRKKGVEI